MKTIHWLLTLLSLMLNCVVIGALVYGVMLARQIAGGAANALESLGNQTINYSLQISQTVPVRTTVPFNQRLDIPINQTVPVDTIIQINPTLPVVGPIALDVPVKTTIPVRITVPISFSQSIPVNADVPINLVVPIQIRIADTELKPQIDAWVRLLRQFAP